MHYIVTEQPRDFINWYSLLPSNLLDVFLVGGPKLWAVGVDIVTPVT